MIGSLRGKLIEKRPNLVLLEVGGVGYQVSFRFPLTPASAHYTQKPPF